MHKTLRRLPSLDFLRGFEATGRRLSFTLAAEELFLTQSALSRQVKALEDALGQPLFTRHHRALSLTPAGVRLHRAVTEVLASLAAAVDSVQAVTRAPGLTITTTVSFASLWMIPRLARFRERHPEVEVYVSADDRNVDLARGEVDIAVRYLPESASPEGALRLFGERMFPVASPALIRRRGMPLRKPADLSRHVLLHLDDPEGRVPWINWQSWLTSNGEPGLRPAGSLRLRLYDQVIQAAVGG
ncbi:MAG TPA: LysR substrate-binding domain-containing protein, partial [Casimicrobiaceae bacterium]|nr:LysR substrate-binding domain-containing protein [Casimicrobiaceae bacterium]